MFPLLSPLRCYDAGLLARKYDIDPTVFHSDEYIDFLRQASTLHSLPEDIVEVHNPESDVDSHRSYCSGGESDGSSASELSFSSIRSEPHKYSIYKAIRDDAVAELSDARELLQEDLSPDDGKRQGEMPGY